MKSRVTGRTGAGLLAARLICMFMLAVSVVAFTPGRDGTAKRDSKIPQRKKFPAPIKKENTLEI
jgi:hypothetical protein